MSTNLKKLLRNQLNPEELGQLVGSYDVVGDIAVVVIPEKLEHHNSYIAETIFATNRKLKTVLRKVGAYDGEFRTLPLEVIGGEVRSETKVQEFGLSYQLDLQSCYFSVRSGTERQRVAGLVSKKERVLVLFSGIGPYPLAIAKKSGALVVGVEKNPEAHRYAVENVRRNGFSEKISLHHMDAALFLQEQERSFDRIVMPLPKPGEPFLLPAMRALRCGGVLHYYKMAGVEMCTEICTNLNEIASVAGFEVEKIDCTKAGHCGNKIFRWCFDCYMKNL